MKKFTILSLTFLAVFILLICISSFSWAAEPTTQFDLDLSDFSVTETLHVDFTGTNYTLEDYPYIYIMKRDNVFEVDFCKLPLYYSSSYNYNNNTYYIFACSTLNTDIIYNLYRLNNDVYEMYSNFINTTNVTYSTGYGGLVSNEYIYTDSSLSTQYTGFNYIVNGSIIEGGEGEGEGGDNENGFFADFWDNLIHIVVPNSEDWADLQDSFEDDILDKFHITSMSFNDDLQYNWDDSGLYSPIKSAPTISFGSWGTIDLSGINDLMHMPLSFGIMQVQFGQWEPVDRQVETNGVTLYDLVNFILILDVFICNIFLYNKFFAKGE